MASALGEAFVVVRPELTKFGSELSTGIGSAVSTAETDSSGAFNKLAGVGKAAFLGIAAAAVGFGAEAIDAALKGQEATAQLANSVRVAGGNWDDLKGHVEDVTAGYAKFGISNDEAEAALTRLVQITNNVGQSENLLATAANLAAARHIDLTAAANLVGRAAEGNITPLKRMGIVVADTGSAAGNAQAALTLLNERFGGAAQAQADTYAGKLKAFRAETENLTEKVGNALLPVLAGLAGDAAGVVGFFEKDRAAAVALGVVIGGPLVVAVGAYLAQQAKTIALGAVQQAQKLPQFFLTLGAAMSGTTASEVVLNETTAVTNTTMAAGAIATGALIGGLGLLVYRLESAKHAADDWAESIAKGAGPDPQAQLAALEQQLTKTAKAADDVHVGFVHFTEGGKENADKVSALKSKIGDLKTELVDTKAKTEALGYATVESGNQAEQASSSINQLGEATGLSAARAQLLADKLSLDLAKTSLPEATAKVNALSTELSFTSASSQGLHDAFVKLGDQTATATEKVSAFKSALDVLIGGNIDAEKAVVNFQASIDGLSAKLAANKLSLDATTQAGRDNITAVEDSVVAIRNHIEAMKNQGASADALQGAFQGDTDALRRQLQQAGFTKAQIDQLIASYGLVPGSLNTVISADTGGAAAAIGTLTQQFNLLYATVRQIGSLSGSVGGVRRLARGAFFSGGNPELAVVGDSREVMLPLDDPRRMAELLAQAGVGGGGARPAVRPAAAAAAAVNVTFEQYFYGPTMPDDLRRAVVDVVDGELGQVVDRALAGVGRHA